MKKVLIPLMIAAIPAIIGCGPKINPHIHLPGKIIYTTEHEGSIHVMRIDPQGENREALTNADTLRGASSFFDACLLPDGESFVVVANIYGNNEIVLIEPGPDPKVTQLTDNKARDISPSVTPDGRYVVYASDSGGDLEIYKLDLENPDLEPERLTRSKSNDTDPVVRPDGRFIAFISDRPGAYDLYAIDLTGEEPLRRLTDEEGDVSKPSFSLDGEYVIYEVMIHGNPEIAYCNFDSPTEHGMIVETEEWSEYSPCFSPSGSYICVVSNREGASDLYIYTFWGDLVRRITDTPEFDTDTSWTW
ncbi:PD40 domain-containing protein [bacterium]|nr:PD40 domain-containing protein [bacterium]